MPVRRATVPQRSVPRPRATLVDYGATGVEVAIVATALFYVVTSSVAVLVAWECMTVLYLAAGLVVARRRSLDDGRGGLGRSGFLDTLSWILPLAASLVGINSAVLFLLNRGSNALPEGSLALIAMTAALGIVLSWLLLHTGFAQVYQSLEQRSPDDRGLVFPDTESPMLVDYLYFSFTIGTSFATSDSTVRTHRMRWTVLGHSIISFFYNALVVALAFQILQQLSG